MRSVTTTQSSSTKNSWSEITRAGLPRLGIAQKQERCHDHGLESWARNIDPGLSRPYRILESGLSTIGPDGQLVVPHGQCACRQRAGSGRTRMPISRSDADL